MRRNAPIRWCIISAERVHAAARQTGERGERRRARVAETRRVQRRLRRRDARGGGADVADAPVKLRGESARVVRRVGRRVCEREEQTPETTVLRVLRVVRVIVRALGVSAETVGVAARRRRGVRPVVPGVRAHRAEQQQRRQAFERRRDWVDRTSSRIVLRRSRLALCHVTLGFSREGLFAERVPRGFKRDARKRRRADPRRELGDETRDGCQGRDGRRCAARGKQNATIKRRVDDEPRGFQ